MRGTVLASALLALAAPLSAQQAEVPPAPVTPEQLDFINSNDRMSVPVTISGGGPYRFIVDTGAQRTVISRELAGRLGLAPGPNVRMTAMAGTTDVGTVVIPLISVSTMGGTRIEAPSLESRNLGAPGILGIDTLQGHALSIDFERQIMLVTPSVKRRHKINAAPGEIVVQAKSVFGEMIVTDARYRGQRVRVILDTGSGVTMGNLALQRRVARHTKDVQQIPILDVAGASMLVDYTQIDRFEIGDVTIANLPIAFADCEPFRHFGLTDQPALLLGMDALRLFRHVKIDFANREVRLLIAPDAIGNAKSSPSEAVKLDS